MYIYCVQPFGKNPLDILTCKSHPDNICGIIASVRSSLMIERVVCPVLLALSLSLTTWLRHTYTTRQVSFTQCIE